MSLSFLKYETGDTARQEFLHLLSGQRTETLRIYAHLIAVAAANAIDNRPLSHAEPIPGTSSMPHLYWYRVGDVGVVYAYDGHDVVVISVGLIAGFDTRDSLINRAIQRTSDV